MRMLVSLLVLVVTFAHAQDQRPPIRTGIAGVLIDVTVLDKDGHPVTDLTAPDFEVSEDGKPQQIISATLMRGGVPARISGTTAVATSSLDASRTPAAADTAAAPRAPVPTVTAILFDNLSADTRPFATRAATQFVNTLAAANEYGGVFLCGLRLTTIQPFTNHTADLRAAVERIANTAPSNLSTDTERKNATVRTQGITTETPVTANAEYNAGWTTVQEREQRLYGEPGDNEQYLNRLALRMEEGYSRFLTEYEGEASLSGLRSAVDGLAPLPGRKSILYFTEGVQITARLKSRFDALVGDANRANITIYPVDAAGLRVQSKEGETGRGVELAGKQGIGDAHRNDGAWTKDLEKQDQMLSSGGALGRLANATGGFLIDNTNDLGKGVARMQIERTTYYLLGYQPTNTSNDGKFRRVTVKVKRGKYTVRARPGYVAAR